MTDLLTRPTATDDAGTPAPTRSLVLSAAGSALWAAAMSLVVVTVVVMVSWATASAGGDAPTALRTAAALWLLGHHTPVAVPHGVIGLLPLGLTALPFGLLYRAGVGLGHHLDVRRVREAWVVAATVAASYAVIAAVVAGLAAQAPLRPEPLPALAGAWVLAFVACGAGLARRPAIRDAWLGALPGWARAVGAGAAVGTLTVLAVGAVLVAASLVGHLDRFAELVSALHPGGSGAVGLALLEIAFVPDLAVWGASYALGPGFALGVGTGYSAYAVTAGPAPGLPVLAALPTGQATGSAQAGLAAMMVAAGALVGLAVWRRWRGPAPWWSAAAAFGAAAAAAVVLAVFAMLASGAAGPGRLSVAGPSAWRVGLVALAELGGGAALAAAAAHLATARRVR